MWSEAVRMEAAWRAVACVSSQHAPGSLPPAHLVPPRIPDAALAAVGLLRRGSFGPPALAIREALRARTRGL